MRVLVTVGTTRFDALVDAVDRPETHAMLRRMGYTALTVRGPILYLKCP